MSCLFFSERAFATGSEWTYETMRPFALAFALFSFYLFGELLVLPCVFSRDTASEEHGAGDRLFQDVCDEWLAEHATPLPDYFFERSTPEEQSADAAAEPPISNPMRPHRSPSISSAPPAWRRSQSVTEPSGSGGPQASILAAKALI